MSLSPEQTKSIDNLVADLLNAQANIDELKNEIDGEFDEENPDEAMTEIIDLLEEAASKVEDAIGDLQSAR